MPPKLKLTFPGVKSEPKEEKPEVKLKMRLPQIPQPKPSPPPPQEFKQHLKIKLGPKQKVSSKPTQVKKHVPRIRMKPTRIPGEGYDSEDSEVEDDPLVEEAVILRMLPDAELDYIRHCVESGDLSGISIKWVDRRRCIIHVNRTMYAAKLMRLPNIIEANKSVDKRNIFKSVDVTEILVVLKRITDESQINDVSREEEEYHSGITPPMKNIVKSQHRRKLTKDRIESIEARVDELLRMDEEAIQSSFELVDPDNIGDADETLSHPSSAHPMLPTKLIDEEESAKMFLQASKEKEEMAIHEEAEEAQDEDIDGIEDLEVELEQALEGGLDLDGAEEDEEDDDDDDDDDDDNSDNEGGLQRKVEVDEDEQHNALLRDEIRDLETTIEQNRARLNKTSNALLRDRFVNTISKLEKELENKKRQLRIGEDKTTSKKLHEGDQNQSRSASVNVSSLGVEIEDDDEEDDDDMDMDDDDDDENDNDNDNDDENDASDQPTQDLNDVEIDEADLEDLFG